ncbi:type I polyketide synthase [Nocardia crassostreae]|uniref:type I polyketide synthase n=1 Tax=Nocardia crassostreae TaxID=53428 RepID=UPI000829D191|nr:type I polyketide synthase [Nocardia crassostreae]
MADIAIVGIGCRYAGGIDSPESFWDFIIGKRDGVVDIPADRWDYRRYYDPDKRTPGSMYTKRAAFLTGDPWAFDPDFFGISPREAAAMDPQQRLVLEVAWEALDDAGIARRAAGAPIGVYVGAFTLDHLAVSNSNDALPHVDMHTAAGASYTMLSNRIAFALDLIGPAITVDTACSSSLVALHLACQALDTGDCATALAGGINMLMQPEPFISMSTAGFLAADGRSKPFDAAADGYGRGEGSGMVVLKPLGDAERDGDRIYAVIKATGSNQDGRTTAITVPNAELQEALAKSVTRRAGIAPHDVTYVEAHGTGTPIGDPLELRAIGRAYGQVEGRARPVGVGSEKGQLGHTEAASGIASVIKSALAISKRIIPPQGWLRQPAPDIPFDALGITLQRDAEPVGAEVERMTIAVNGFGYGGTNAHAILQEHAPVALPVREPKHYGIFPISARNEKAARKVARGYAELLSGGADPARLAEAAWTRRHHRCRAGLIFGDDTELLRALRDFAVGTGRRATNVATSEHTDPVFVFTGMGPQWWAMGRELLTASGTFAAEAARIDAEFIEIAGWSIVAELLRPEAESRVTTTAVAQPANFLVQVALFATLGELGIRPAAVVGHSVGEVSAAYVAGMLSLRDALLVSYHRARLQATVAGTGGMLAVALSPHAARELIAEDERVDIAAVNSAGVVTLAGAVTRLREIAETLTEQGVFAKQLHVEVPYHSHLMEPILDELHTALAGLRVADPAIPLWSTVTGERVTGADWDAGYWCANVRHTVRFHDAVTAMIGAGHRVFLEVGPHAVLGASIRETLIRAGESGTSVATLSRKQADSDSLRQTIAGLYTGGALDVDALFDGLVTPHIDLPRYPWQRTHLRSQAPIVARLKFGTPGGYPMLGDLDPELPAGTWQTRLSVGAMPWLADHVVGGARMLPGAAYLDAALSAAALRTASGRVSVADVRFIAPIVIEDGAAPVMELHVEESTGRFTIRARDADGELWTTHATGRLVAGDFEPATVKLPEPDELRTVDPVAFYAGFAARGLDYGPAFRLATGLRVSESTVLATLDATGARDSGHLVDPRVLDAALQSLAALLSDTAGTSREALAPVAVAGVRVFGALPDEVTVLARFTDATGLIADVDLLDAEQNVVVRVIGLRLGAIVPGRGALQRMTDYFYEDRWERRAPVDRTALPAAESGFTFIVDFCSEPGRLAARIAAGSARSEVLAVGDPGREDLETIVHERLWAITGLEDAERLHVVLVAGNDYDDLDGLWALRRLAVAFDEFLDAWLERRGAEIPMIGDGSMHVTLVTEHAYAHPGEATAPNPAHTALAGARRVLLNDQLRLRWRLVDVESEVDTAELAAELAVPGAFTYDYTDEVILRSGERWSTVFTASLPDRLEALDQAVPLMDSEANYTLEAPGSRLLARLGWRRCERRRPGPSEVEVRMRAIGLGDRNPLEVIGAADTEPDRILPGMAGDATVVRIGSEVVDLAVGDRVMLFARGGISRFHTTDRALVTRPGHCVSVMSFAIAEYALLELARLRAGDVVLVHDAAGGPGAAAVRIAKLHGAEVIGTAGTDELRASVLSDGADHALNSSSLDFADDVLRLTEERGADIVLGAMHGEVLHRSCLAAAEFGRIVRIGKAGDRGGVLDMGSFDRNISYRSFDLDRMLRVRRADTVDLLRRAETALAAGQYRPLPVDLYETDTVAQAFEDAAEPDRIGRIALSLEAVAPAVRPHTPPLPVDPAARYLITGGFGAFGLAIGRRLVGSGARHLVLLGRAGASTEASRNQLAAWERQGIEITTERVDVTDVDAVTAALARAHGVDHPLRGVFHTAGIVDDQRIAALERDSLAAVYRPKVEGARALRRALAATGAELDMFVLFSSIAATFGSVGQYSYTAANLALQAIADQTARDRLGLAPGGKALAVGWGHMAGGCMAEADDRVTQYLRTTGFDPIDMDEATEYLERALELDVQHHVAITATDWGRVAAAIPHFKLVGRVRPLIAAAADNDSAAAKLRSALRELDEQQRTDFVAGLLAEQLATVLGVESGSIDRTTRLPDLGVDSLMGVEFGALIVKTLGIDLSTLTLGRSFTLQQAAARTAESLVGGGDEP